ncbi:hypothetical protein CYMTET_9925 [Cymbomonas tetramitiformis]|uniref:Uncharacterized protein n=1 Tax=Cymbomonas tetramitiformis TaxID=36881 RepID=A0AAE0GQJ3_9CHLO|nr:hypothetical protein CYMTET_41616 [Cymbomonas tetramitiformis]KAK3282330.1 hypothetical protein CYMTET_9925 [Cymbomonas tetramitiformis]
MEGLAENKSGPNTKKRHTRRRGNKGLETGDKKLEDLTKQQINQLLGWDKQGKKLSPGQLNLVNQIKKRGKAAYPSKQVATGKET